MTDTAPPRTTSLSDLGREMAADLAISEGALRTRAHHLRVDLANCVMECVKSLGGNKTPVPRHK